MRGFDIAAHLRIPPSRMLKTSLQPQVASLSPDLSSMQTSQRAVPRSTPQGLGPAQHHARRLLPPSTGAAAPARAAPGAPEEEEGEDLPVQAAQRHRHARQLRACRASARAGALSGRAGPAAVRRPPTSIEGRVVA